MAVEEDDDRLTSRALVVREVFDEHRAVIVERVLSHAAVCGSAYGETKGIYLVGVGLRSRGWVGQTDGEARRQIDRVVLRVQTRKLDGANALRVLLTARCLGLSAVDDAWRHRALDPVARATKDSWERKDRVTNLDRADKQQSCRDGLRDNPIHFFFRS